MTDHGVRNVVGVPEANGITSPTPRYRWPLFPRPQFLYFPIRKSCVIPVVVSVRRKAVQDKESDSILMRPMPALSKVVHQTEYFFSDAWTVEMRPIRGAGEQHGQHGAN